MNNAREISVAVHREQRRRGRELMADVRREGREAAKKRALLNAAAPDLLQALAEILISHNSTTEKNALAAIAKAKGKAV